MAITLRFRSILRQDVAYTFHTDRDALWSAVYRTASALGPECGEYLTFGDGVTQHGGEYCAVRENFADYCASLAAELCKVARSPDFSDDEVESLAYAVAPLREFSREQIVFALSVVHKADEGKTQYFNPLDRKIRTVAYSKDKLRYDKRWLQVDSWMDGSVKAAVRVLLLGEAARYDREPRQPHVLESYALHRRVWEVAEELSASPNGYHLDVPEMCGIVAGEVDRYDNAVRKQWIAANDAFLTLRTMFSVVRGLSDARRGLDAWKANNVARPDADVVEAAVPAEKAGGGN